MRAIVDSSTCTACGICAETCPTVFRMGADCAEVTADPVPPEEEACAREASAGCPVGAISIEPA